MSATCNNCGKPTTAPVKKRTGGYCGPCELVTIPEACLALHASRATYYRYVRQERIKPRKLTPGNRGAVLVPRSDVDAILRGVST